MGFFTKEQIQSHTMPEGKRYSCEMCGLYKFVFSPKMKPFGEFKKKILNIGEAPGEEEDKKGNQWQGKVGRRLQREYKRLGVDLFEDCVNINSINCRPTDAKGNNRAPTKDEIAMCRSRVLSTIDEYKPKVVMLFGSSAIESLIGYRWNRGNQSVSLWRGWTIPDREFNTWICPVFHPSYIERQQDSKDIEMIWRQDLERGLGMAEVLFPKYKPESKGVEIIEDLTVLEDIDSEFVAIDYETTGIKPHKDGHKVICASVAYDEGKAYSFLIPKDKDKLRPFLQLLQSKKVKKIAHNLKFEDTWTKERLGCAVNNWAWDTMLASHILDNRPGSTGLKFQAYVNFGLINYTSSIDTYIKSNSKNSNAFNRFEELAKKKEGARNLMVYCGIDTIMTYRLAKKQMEAIKNATP